MYSDEARAALPAEALETLRAVWDWDYRTWETVAERVTGPLADLLRRNMADEETEPGKTLLDLSIAAHSIDGGGTARVEAEYVWQEAAREPVTERIVWFFLREDGRWKAAGLTR